MRKIEEREKENFICFAAMAMPLLEAVRTHMKECELPADNIMSIAITQDGYLRIEFCGIDGVAICRSDSQSKTTVRFTEEHDVQV